MRRIATAFALLIVAVGTFTALGVPPAAATPPPRVLAIRFGPDLEVNPVTKDYVNHQLSEAGNAALIDALRNGGDLLNVFGDFPTLSDPRHADAYSPLWDAQLGQWTDKAIKEGFDKRQIDEVQVFNLAATRPDLITGPGGASYGAQGVDINCAVIGFTDKAPTANLADPVPNSQFPPR